MAFFKRTMDKDQAIDKAAYIAKNFEPNSNYELDIMVRRDRINKKYWIVSLRLIFPHMHYKRKIVQESLIKGLEHRVIPSRKISGRAAGHMIKKCISLLDEYQCTLSNWALV